MTEAGALLLEEARRIFVQLDQTVRAVQRVGHGQVGQLLVSPSTYPCRVSFLG
jgi:DNA-binding transcriptional LysR family regulator